MPAQSATPNRIVILHTGDIHGHIRPWKGWEGDLRGRILGGFDRLASVVGEARAEVGSDRVLLLDSGDAFGDTEPAARSRGSVVVELMNAVGYTAMAIGNHEPDFGLEALRTNARRAKFPLLAANLVVAGEAFTRPHEFVKLRGVRVALVGLAYPNTPLTTARKNVEGITFEDPVAAARREVERVRRDGAQLVIVIAHLGLGAEKQLAKAVLGIDIILGGHSHNRTVEPIREGATIIVQAGAHLSDVGRLDLELERGVVRRASYRLITLDNSTVSRDVRVGSVLDSISPPDESTPIATARAPIVRAQTLAGQDPRSRHEESPADSLFADIISAATGADAVFLPGVGYGVALAAGPISQPALKNLIPHDSKVVTMRLSGAEIRGILEQSIENVLTNDSHKKIGGMIQVGGIQFSYDPDRAVGQRVRSVQIGGADLDPDREYRVATNSMLAAGGHNYSAFVSGRDIQERESQFEMVAAGLSRRSPVETPPPGRIRRVGQ